MKRVKRISYPLPLVPQETDPVASVSVKTRPMSAFMDNHAVVFRDKPCKLLIDQTQVILGHVGCFVSHADYLYSITCAFILTLCMPFNVHLSLSVPM